MRSKEEQDAIVKRALGVVVSRELGEPVLCPVCGFEYVHLALVVVDQGSERVTIREGETVFSKIKPGEHRGWGRGSYVEIQFWCEGRHQFSQVLQFHKGITTMQTIVRETFEAWPAELWRD